MGNTFSKSSEPASPVTFPIGLFPEYTMHQDQMRLELELWPNGSFVNKDNLRTIVRDLNTKQPIFSISPLERGAHNNEIVQTLYSSSDVPLLTLTNNQSTRRDTEYICRLAVSDEEVFRAKEGVSSGSSSCVYMFRDHLGQTEGQSTRIKVRKSGKISAWDVQIGNLQFYSSWKRGSNHLLTVKPGVDVALMVISTLCLHRIEQAASSRAMTSAQASSSAAAASGFMMQASAAASTAGASGAP